jgi:cobalamin biosynthesis protein CobT
MKLLSTRARGSVARKQLEGPFTAIARATSKRWDVQITASGTVPKTDGKVIAFPWNADDIDTIPFEVLNGYLDHEVGHIVEEREHEAARRATPFTILNAEPKKARRLLFNAFEDIRMELKRGKLYPGVAENLAAANVHSARSYAEHGAGGSFWGNITSMIVLHAHGLPLAGFPAQHVMAFSVINEEVAGSTRAVWAEDSKALADNAYEKLMALAEPKKESGDDEEQDEEGEGDDASEEGEDDEESDEEKAKPAGEDEQEEEPEEGEDDSDAGEEPDGDEEQPEGDEGEEGAGDEDGEDEGANEDEQEGQEGEDDTEEGDEDEEGDEAGSGGDSDDDSDGDDGEGDDEDADQGGEGGDRPDSFDADEREDAELSDADPDHDPESVFTALPESGDGDMEDLKGELEEEPELENLMDELKRDIAEAAEDNARSGYVPDPVLASLDRWDVESDHNPRRYEMLVEVAREQTHALKAKMLQILAARTQARTEFDQEQGRLDTSALHQLRLGSKRVFSKVIPGLKIDTAVSIIFDLSGSMGRADQHNSKAYFARLLGVALGETFTALNVPLEMIGFHNMQRFSCTAEQLTHINKGGDGITVPRLPFQYLIFKAFHEPYKKVKTRMVGITGREQNADGEAVLAIAKRLHARPEKRKILFVISDGEPYCPGLPIKKGEEHLREAITRVTNSGIEVFGIGMNHSTIGSFYGKKQGAHSVVISGINDMAREIFKAVRLKFLGRAA